MRAVAVKAYPSSSQTVVFPFVMCDSRMARFDLKRLRDDLPQIADCQADSDSDLPHPISPTCAKERAAKGLRWDQEEDYDPFFSCFVCKAIVDRDETCPFLIMRTYNGA